LRITWTDRGIKLAIWAALLLAIAAAFATGTGYLYVPVEAALPAPVAADPSAPVDEEVLAALRSENRKLTRELRRKVPNRNYIVIDQSNNRLYLRRGDRVLLDAVCSAGSGILLRDVQGDRHWIFDTPRGRHSVRNRVENPVWKKPDWAFLEMGEPIPRDPDERLEYGTLGEYALYLGDGYMIHGTLYERLLGRSVTHGCVRLGRDDLRTVWRSTGFGTPVFIF
jgi:L,D-transpeptidase YbiS